MRPFLLQCLSLSLQETMVNKNLLVVLLCATCHVALSFTDGLLPNGNFENGPKPWQMKGTVVIGQNSIPNWEISGHVEYIKSGQPVPESTHAVRLGNGASIKQRVMVEKGLYYSITFRAVRSCEAREKLRLSVAPDFYVFTVQSLYNTTKGWDSYAWAFKADNEEVDIQIHNYVLQQDPACGPIIYSIAMKTLHPPKRIRGTLKNGNFEEGPYVFPNATSGVLIGQTIGDHSPLPGWIVKSPKAVRYIDAEHFSVSEGKRAIELLAGEEIAIYQRVRTIPGADYALTFEVGDDGTDCKGALLVEGFAGRYSINFPYESNGEGGFKKATLRFRAINTRTLIMFRSAYYTVKLDGTICGPVIDNVKLSRWDFYHHHHHSG